MFRTVPLSIIRSFSLYTQQWYMSYRFADSLRAGSGRNGQNNCPKHVEFYSKNKFEKLVHLVGFIIRIYHYARSPERQNSSVTLLASATCFKTTFPVAKFSNEQRYRLSIFLGGLRETTKPLTIIAISSDIRSKTLPNKSAERYICARVFGEISMSVLQSSLVTICTTRFNIQKFYVLPTQRIYMFCSGSQNKERLFPYTALTGWFL